MKKRLPFLAFLFFYLVFAFATFRDYGCTWDEPDAYQGGAELYQYLVHGVPMAYLDPEHGYPYTFLLNFISSPTDFTLLHLLNLLFSALLFGAVYEMLLSHCGNGLWALAGPVFLSLNLPFLGSIPANPKDVPFGVFYFLSLSALYLYRRLFPEGRFGWFFFGLLAGFTISARIVGFTLFPVMVGYDFYLWKAGSPKAKNRGGKSQAKFWPWIRSNSRMWLGSFAVSQFLCVLLWPFIGRDYFKNLPLVFWLSSHFPPKFDFLFMGHMSDSLGYPWYYLPLLILLTTPLFILVFFLVSLGLSKNLKTNPLFVLWGGTLALNLLLYFLLHPAVYDGLRHFLYLLPLLSALASLAFIEFFQKQPWSAWHKAAAGLTLAASLLTVTDLVRLHPYEYVYFNELAGGFKGAYGNFETDYWVASFKEAVDWLRDNELKAAGGKLEIFAEGDPPQTKIYTDPRWDYVMKQKDADYAIVMTRAGIKPDPQDETKVIHRVEREGAPLCYILRLK